MRLRVSLLILGLAALPAGAQQRDVPAKDTRPHGVLRGTVVASDTGRPVLRAQVTARLAGPRASGGATMTDVSGVFELRLPPGEYTVTAARSGAFLDTQYGQVHPELPGKLVTVAANETRAIEIAMMKPGVIAGRVFDEAGDPLANAGIVAMRQQRSGHGHRFSTMIIAGTVRTIEGGSDTSNDRGEFRIFGLMPGEYLLVGHLRGAAPFSIAPVSVKKAAQGSTAEPRRPAAIYFPGVSDPARAMRLRLEPGQEIANADFTIRYVPAILVAGMAVGPDDVPVSSGSIALYVPGVEGLAALAQNATIQKDGTFRFEALPGQYTVRARHQMRGTPESSRYGADLSLAVPLAVTEADISGLFLKLTYGAGLKGRVQFDAGVQPQDAAGKVKMMVESGVPGARVSATHHEDGTFIMSGIEAGSRRLLASAPAGWIVKGVFQNGRDVSDLPIEFQDGVTIENVSVLLTNVSSPLAISVEQRDGGPTAAIAVFPADPATWHLVNPRIQFHPATSAPVTIDSLPAGEYLVVAIAEVDAQSLRKDDTTLLERLGPFAERVRLVEGVPTAVRVRPVALPR